MSGEEQGEVNQGELYAPGIRPLPFDPGGPSRGAVWENVRLLCAYSGSIFFFSVYDHCLRLSL